MVRHDRISSKTESQQGAFGAAWLSPPTDRHSLPARYFSSSNIIAQHEGALPIDTPADDRREIGAGSRQIRQAAQHGTEKTISQHQIEGINDKRTRTAGAEVLEQRGESALVGSWSSTSPRTSIHNWNMP
ncbi:MAG: hypothetical protein IPO00_11425 [Betaproteobacteria bacterium]|nr:hypothetical protein [Betaproteobacteria bacterium]